MRSPESITLQQKMSETVKIIPQSTVWSLIGSKIEFEVRLSRLPDSKVNSKLSTLINHTNSPSGQVFHED
jgi:hypothetical protein